MKHLIRNPLFIVAAGTMALIISAVPKPGAHAVETGPAKFLRDHDTAMAQAKKTGKPVFAFFQEVPG